MGESECEVDEAAGIICPEIEESVLISTILLVIEVSVTKV